MENTIQTNIPKTLTVARDHLLTYVAGAESCGLDLEKHYRRNGISKDQIENPRSRIPYDNLSRLRLDLCRTLDDESAGFFERPSPWGTTVMFCQAIISSRNLREAFGRYQNYSMIMSDEVTVEFTPHSDEASVCIDFENRKAIDERAEVESKLFFLLSFALWLSGGRFRPSRIGMAFEAPPYADDYTHIIPTKYVFGQSTNSLVFDGDLLREPVRQTARSLNQFLSNHLSYLIDQNLSLGDVIERVRHVVMASIGTAPSLESVSDVLRMAPTTLRRRLKDKGVTFQEIKDEVRTSRAIHYLSVRHMSVAETAELIGFSDPASFSRAFKGWTGKSPSDYSECSAAS